MNTSQTASMRLVKWQINETASSKKNNLKITAISLTKPLKCHTKMERNKNK